MISFFEKNICGTVKKYLKIFGGTIEKAYICTVIKNKTTMENKKHYETLYNALTGGEANITEVKNANHDTFYDIVQSVYDYLDSVPEKKLPWLTVAAAKKGWIAFMEQNCEEYAVAEEDSYSCDICGKRHKWDDIVWLSSSYGVCEDCVDKIPDDIRQKIEDDVWDLDVEMWVDENCTELNELITGRKKFIEEHRKDIILFFFDTEKVDREEVENGMSRDEMAENCCCMILLEDFDTNWNDSDDDANYIPNKEGTWCYVSIPEK